MPTPDPEPLHARDQPLSRHAPDPRHLGSLPPEIEIELGLDEADDEASVRRKAARKVGIGLEDLPEIALRKRSIDARHGKVVFRLVFEVDPAPHELGAPETVDVDRLGRVIVIGDGPAGLFCAYELARRGVGCTVVDRGKTVQPRRRDLRGLNQFGIVDSDSNYCFGEGGAGTYSDGKLYTRSHKRGDCRDVLELLAIHGAPAEILTDARPHIGSNKLPKVITAIRQRLEGHGVGFRFGVRVVSLLTREEGGRRRIAGVRLHTGEELGADAVVLATGHSARDVFRMLVAAGVTLQPKPFAVGVRIEHPQPFINRIQYGRHADHPKLPNAAYRLAHTEEGRGVFSFCMCPGGFVVPASTDAGALVLNGMSLSKRNSPHANSGLVVGIEVEDAHRAGFSGPLAGMELQRRIEETAWQAGGGGLRAPATRASDFVAGRASTTVPATSYQPGLAAGNVADVLDVLGLGLADRIRSALRVFDRKMRGYVTDEAVLIGVESRTSAPVRVPRDPESLVSPDLRGLYPCGEGAGYAGGIMSAAMDGMKVARAVAEAVGRG
jgi:uncharacterized FAD-dependent dehydrogenase